MKRIGDKYFAMIEQAYKDMHNAGREMNLCTVQLTREPSTGRLIDYTAACAAFNAASDRLEALLKAVG